MINKLYDFYNWVMGNGPKTENNEHAPEPAPNLPFAWTPIVKKKRFHEATMRERFDEWLEHQGTGLFSSLYASVSILTCVLLMSLLVLTASGLPENLSLAQRNTQAIEARQAAKTETTGNFGIKDSGNMGFLIDLSGKTDLDLQLEKLSEHIRPRIIGVSLVLFAAITGVCVLYGPRRILSKTSFSWDWGSLTRPRFSGRALTGAALFLIGGVVVALTEIHLALAFAGAGVMTLALLFHPGLHSSVKSATIRVSSAGLIIGAIVVVLAEILPFKVTVISVICATASVTATLYVLCLMLAAPDARD